MSWWLKLLTSFPAFGVGATYSLIAVSKNREVVEVLPPPAVEKKEKVQQETEINKLMQQIIEEKKYEGCAELTNNSRWRSSLWFVCSGKENSYKPSFYNYKRTRKGKVLAQIASISSSSKRKMMFTGGGEEQLTTLPSWIYKLRGKELVPESNCTFTEGEKIGKEKSYVLTCHEQEIQRRIQLENKSK